MVREIQFLVLVFVAIPLLSLTITASRLPAQEEIQATEVREWDQSIQALESELSVRNRELEHQIGRVAQTGSELRESKARVAAVEDRAEEIRAEHQNLEQIVQERQGTVEAGREEYAASMRAAYRGEGFEDLVRIFGGLVGSSGEGGGFVQQAQTSRVLNYRQSNMEQYRSSQTELENTARQLEQKDLEYSEALEERRRQEKESRERERELERSVAEIGEGVQRTEAELARLHSGREELLLRPAVSTGSAGNFGYEMSVAGSITAVEVGELPLEEYQRLYRAAAEEYGFGEDWYILAAIGRIESNHGENLGPSTAGALGPMQFLPSTWKSFGVDGNGNGRTNIMDPEDAIPAAASYLVLHGAPEDWYRALFAYNRADWYVKQVLAVAEAYRQRADDDSIGPYA